MTEHGTIKIPREEYEKHNEKRKEMGLSWKDYIDGESPEIPNGCDLDELRSQLAKDRQTQLEEVVYGATCDVALAEQLDELSR